MKHWIWNLKYKLAQIMKNIKKEQHAEIKMMIKEVVQEELENIKQ